MNESKELLEATVKGLEEKIGQLNMDLKDKQRELVRLICLDRKRSLELKDVSKPEMTEEMYGNLEGIVEEAIEHYDFSDSENYDIEFGIDYDGKVEASSLEFNSAHELKEKIMRGVEKAYKMTDTQVTNATHVEKVI